MHRKDSQNYGVEREMALHSAFNLYEIDCRCQWLIAQMVEWVTGSTVQIPLRSIIEDWK